MNKSYFLYNIIFFSFLFILIRLLIINQFGIIAKGDWDIYLQVAENILNGCGVSISKVSDDVCVPHFGGNQGPGFPLFVASIWFLFGKSEIIIIYFQNIFLLFSSIIILKTIFEITKSNLIVLISATILNFSPLYLGWANILLTEILSISLYILIYNYVLRIIFLNDKSFVNILKIATIFSILTFIRLDAILLSISIIIVLLLLFNIKEIIRYSSLGLFIFIILWGGWTIRNVNVGLSIIPNLYTISDMPYSPKGYIKWVSTWSTNQYEVSNAIFPLYKKNYKNINFDKNKKIYDYDKIEKLLVQIRNSNSPYLPKEIDNEFNKISSEFIKNNYFKYYFEIILKRSFNMWSNPYNSFGWPLELNFSHKERTDFLQSTIYEKFNYIFKHKKVVGGKLFINIWKWSILLGFIILSIKVFRLNSDRKIKILTYFILSFILTKTFVMSYLNMNFSRYLVPLFPLIEVYLIIGINIILTHQKSLRQFHKKIYK